MAEQRQSLQHRIAARLFDGAFDALERVPEPEKQSLLVAVGRRVLQGTPQSSLEGPGSEAGPTPNFREGSPLELIREQTFRNQIVEVDGNEFVDCTFGNVTFKFNGRAPFRFTTVHFENGSKIAVASDNREIQAAIELTAGVMKLINASQAEPQKDK